MRLLIDWYGARAAQQRLEQPRAEAGVMREQAAFEFPLARELDDDRQADPAAHRARDGAHVVRDVHVHGVVTAPAPVQERDQTRPKHETADSAYVRIHEPAHQHALVAFDMALRAACEARRQHGDTMAEPAQLTAERAHL